MFRGVLLFGVLGVTGITGIATSMAVGADPKPTDDLGALQGNWKPLQCEYQGSPQMPIEVMKQVTGVYDKSEYFLYFVDKKDGKPDVLLLAQANITLDPTSNPKGISFEFADGPLKGVKRHGIYEIAGNQLKLCYGPSDRPKPTEFKSMPGNGYFLETWARQAK
jgi:uncharacterized protein (TIGR03067 family)